MRALWALYLISTLLSGQTKSCGAFRAIAEDVDITVLIVALGLSRGVEGKYPSERTAEAQKPFVLAATLIYILGQGSPRGDDKDCNDRCQDSVENYVFSYSLHRHELKYYISNNENYRKYRQKQIKLVVTVSAVHKSIKFFLKITFSHNIFSSLTVILIGKCIGKHQLDPVFLINFRSARIVVYGDYIYSGISLLDRLHHSLARNVVR